MLRVPLFSTRYQPQSSLKESCTGSKCVGWYVASPLACIRSAYSPDDRNSMQLPKLSRLLIGRDLLYSTDVLLGIRPLGQVSNLSRTGPTGAKMLRRNTGEYALQYQNVVGPRRHEHSRFHYDSGARRAHRSHRHDTKPLYPFAPWHTLGSLNTLDNLWIATRSAGRRSHSRFGPPSPQAQAVEPRILRDITADDSSSKLCLLFQE